MNKKFPDVEWKNFADRLHRLEYLLNDAISNYSDIYQDLDIRLITDTGVSAWHMFDWHMVYLL